MGKRGGRPRAEDIWEHVTKLPGGKQVECKYCKFVFAASTDRIRSHIHRIEGKGIRICPKSEKALRDLKEKEDLSDSQGLLNVDKSRDYNKPHMLDCYMSPKTMWEGLKAIQQVHTNNEAIQSRDYNKPHDMMLDCYMSAKTMWEGIKAIQEVHTNNEAIHQERIKVGPFYVSNILNERDLQLIQYVFEHSSDGCKVFSSSRSFLNQSDFTTLRPKTHLDSWVIDIFADILTDIEKRKKSKPFNWYLPETFSRAAINTSSFVNFVEKQKMRENYMFGDLKYCEKIFIPVHVEKNNCGHYYLYIIHMKNWEVEIWDSLCPSFLDEPERAKNTQKLLCAMEELFGKVIMFTKFDSRVATNILLQPNGDDCAVFVINYMQQSDNYVRQNPLFKFDSDKERLALALKLIKNDLNGEKEELYKAARSYAKVQSEEALDLCGIKRKRLDTSKTVFGDVEGRGADMELDDSDNRDEKRNNVGLKTECIKGYELMTTDLVGDELQSHTQQILGWIMKNEVASIGIWGMGGAGKTALAIHVNNKPLQEASYDFNHISWLTMSQCGNSVYELQKAMARSIYPCVSGECDVRRISEQLLKAFKHISKCDLILDDVWDPISLEEVRFPVSNNGIKLILTSRSWEVCQSMIFSNMPALQILDLSGTGIDRLPNCVANLECLIALLLSHCEKLSYVPSLAKLQQLIELDLSYTAITEAPCGLELLVNLRCLNLEGAEELEISSAAISKMTNLQSLLMNGIPKSMVSARDIQGLRKLEVISVNFCDIEELTACVNGFLGEDCKLKKYCLSSDLSFDSMFGLSPLDPEREVVLRGVDLGNRGAILPKDINKLIVSGCDLWTRTTCLGDALSFHTDNSIDLPRIESLEISESNKLEYLCCMSAHCSFCHCVQLVGALSLCELKDLKQIVAPYTTPFWASPFVHLTHLDIFECSSMKIVMTPGLLAQLQNLETISVGWCESMEEIVGENYCSGNTSNSTIINLPKLRSVQLLGLPKLNSVFRGTMFCPSLKNFEAFSCEKLSPPDIEIVEGLKLHLEIGRGECIWDYDRIEEEEEEEDEDEAETEAEEEAEEEDEDEDEEEEEEQCEGLNGDWQENEDLNGDWVVKWIAELMQS